MRGLGFTPHRTSSVGLENLVRERKGWPRQGMQFCTIELKIKPALAWLDANDPERQATCFVGVRRAESVNRRDFPERIEKSANHGDRALWAPLVSLSDEERDVLIKRAGFDPLPHRSMECYPCINANRRDLRQLSKDVARIQDIERIETDLGFTSKGKPRTMFRPYHYMGATGIRQVVKWAEAERGKFSLDDGTGSECDTGYCGL